MNDPAALYQQLGNLVATMPDLYGDGWTTTEARKWLGRAAALVEVAGEKADSTVFNVSSNHLGTVLHTQNVDTIITILHRCLARAELKAPVAAQGSFIPVGEAFTAVSALVKIFGSAAATVLIVDPYADANLLTDFAVLAPDVVRVMVMADKAKHRPALLPAAKAWVQQQGQTRPLEVRLAPAKTLHDRLIVIDDRDAWTVGQSFNALATRAPTSFVRVDPETARMKVDAYRSMWTSAESLL